jgi:uncharacterized protein (DUF608 family)
MGQHDIRTFDASATAAAFLLGGIGTGNVAIGARGELRDWEIFNHPGKGHTLPNTFFALRAAAPGRVPVTRVLEGPLQPPHTLSHGYHPATAAGLPRLAQSRLRGTYPMAMVSFDDPQLPVQVELEAWTPFIPLNAVDSGIPCAILTYRITNPSSIPVDLTLVGSLFNPIGEVAFDRFGNLAPGGLGQNVNEIRDEGDLRGLFLHSHQYAPGDVHYGNMSLVTTHPNVTVKRAWLRGAWWDFLQEFWDDLCADGQFTDIGYDTPSADGHSDTGSLGIVDTLGPGERRDYRFILTWFFPNRRDSWSEQTTRLTQNHYATVFASSWMVARSVVEQMLRLEAQTRSFRDALFDSTLPITVTDAIAANLVPLRSTTCFWLADGRFFGWEGCFDDAGCCAGSCTHVWSYAYTLAFLFPSLEREMRRIEFVVETETDGYMTFRTFKSFDEQFIWAWGADQKPEAAIDGQMGSVLRVYREWRLSADRAWLAEVWPGVKRAMVFASQQWDTDQDGVPDGKQHNTYDIEFYGPNPLGGIYYLAGLRATEELARVMGEWELAERCQATFAKGSRNLDQMLWNGAYYEQRIADVDAHKYQHGTGVLADQLLGQLHARVLGLGDLLPAARVRSAIKAVFDYNFRRDFRDHANCQRTYVLNDEAGLLLCTWPRGGRPRLPFVYSDEVWTGIEYHVAAHLIYEGWLDAGLELVAAVRARHDGVRRNPWDEVECGHHYARSMSSWVLLTALSGYQCDMAQAWMSFTPQIAASIDPVAFSCLWSCGRGWGTYTQRRDADGAWHPEVTVLGGDMSGVTVTACDRTWML